MSEKPIVCIINAAPEYVSMFRKAGWKVDRSMKHADLIQFTGGADVSPVLYNKPKHPKTISNIIRDRREMIIFEAALRRKIPMAGICRGGQFLNVMCGGGLVQHIDGHVIAGTHRAVDKFTNKIIEVTSTHHQMMLPGPEAVVVMISRESTKRDSMKTNGHSITVFDSTSPDYEALYYPKHRVFCFQPHPETGRHPKLLAKYFDYLNNTLLHNH